MPTEAEIMAALSDAIEAFERVSPGALAIYYHPTDRTIAATLPGARTIHNADGKPIHVVAEIKSGRSAVSVFGDAPKPDLFT